MCKLTWLSRKNYKWDHYQQGKGAGKYARLISPVHFKLCRKYCNNLFLSCYHKNMSENNIICISTSQSVFRVTTLCTKLLSNSKLFGDRYAVFKFFQDCDQHLYVVHSANLHTAIHLTWRTCEQKSHPNYNSPRKNFFTH